MQLDTSPVVEVGDVLIFHMDVDVTLAFLVSDPQVLALDFIDAQIAAFREKGVLVRVLYSSADEATSGDADFFVDVEFEVLGYANAAPPPQSPQALQANVIAWAVIASAAALAVAAVSSLLITYRGAPTIEKAIDAFDPGRPLPEGEETVGTHLGDNVASAFKSSAVVAVAGAVVVLLFFLWSRKNNE